MKVIQDLLDIMRRLRDPESGCPWDREQTFASIVPHTLEEAYEVAETIEAGNHSALCDELGDLLFQIVFYARLAEEQGEFDFEAIARGLADKLVRRHPHVFAGESVASSAEQTRAWETLKAEERAASASTQDSSALAGVSLTLPALSRAQKLQRRAARVGFDWPSWHGAAEKIPEELGELRAGIDANDSRARIEEEVGDVLFSCVNLARHLEVDAEAALRRAGRKFETRFKSMETELAAHGGVAAVDFDTRERVWEEVKRRES